MYQLRPSPTWPARLAASARTLAAIVLTALLVSALTVQWSSQASATGAALSSSAFTAQAGGIPVTVDGTLVGVDEARIGVLEHGAESPVAFLVGDDTRVVRLGENVPLDTLRSGDTVRMTVDGLTGTALSVQAAPASAPVVQVPAAAALLAALGLIAGATALAIVNRDRLPALPARHAAPRLLPVAVSR